MEADTDTAAEPEPGPGRLLPGSRPYRLTLAAGSYPPTTDRPPRTTVKAIYFLIGLPCSAVRYGSCGSVLIRTVWFLQAHTTLPVRLCREGATALLGVRLSGSSSGPAIPRASKGVCQALIGGFGLPSPV